jgi:hypothetical protein
VLARAKAADDAAMIAQQKLEIAKLRRQIYRAALGAQGAHPRRESRMVGGSTYE